MKKQLAIKGHETRGKEIIEILQMLGGKKTIYSGKDIFHIYSLNVSGEITSELYRKDCSLTSLTYDVFTLEEFLEKFSYKIGDKVSLDNKLRLITWMCWECNKIYYMVQGIDDMFTKKVTADELKPYKEEVRLKDNTDPLHELCENICKNKLSTLMIDSEVCDDEVEIVLNNYEIEVRDGKTYAVKKKSKYPTTYEECCGILGITFDYPDIRMVTTDEFSLYSNFIQLIRCRDAYWKFADNWKPDWTDNNEKKYIINFYQNEINFTNGTNAQYILSFSTAEMRDAFYENFKNLIEKCKQLL